jgi:two-component system chemotaxis response regulator CheY
MKTLIVDDDFTSRLLLQTVLSPYGECHIAVNGKEAVAAFQSALAEGQNYDLVCMDIMMPEMDGQSAIRAIREHELNAGLRSKGARIIMTTALGDIKDVSGAFQGECDAYLLKPINTSKLIGDLKSSGLVQ